MSKSKTVSLVLGSGGARGLAHIGIIRWLKEHGFKIASISGSSMGALSGGDDCPRICPGKRAAKSAG